MTKIIFVSLQEEQPSFTFKPIDLYEQFDEFVQGAETERVERDIREGEAKNVYKFFN